MSKRRTVTLETDGLRDFVRLPDGVRYVLGTMSVLRLVATLVSDRRMQRRAIEEFNRTGQATVVLDLNSLFDLLAPKPLRRVASLLIPPHDRTSTHTEGTPMSDSKRLLDIRLSYIEHVIREMGSHVASGNRVPSELHRDVRKAAISLPDFGDQSKNKSFYGLGDPEVDTVEDGGWTPPTEVTHPVGKTASLIAKTLTKVAETSDKVDALESAGRRFNASKAQSDLHRIATEIHALLSDETLPASVVTEGVERLAAEADHIHGIFAPVRA